VWVAFARPLRAVPALSSAVPGSISASSPARLNVSEDPKFSAPIHPPAATLCNGYVTHPGDWKSNFRLL
jgi:hypothetical protein